MDQRMGTCEAARNTRRWPRVTSSTVLNVAEINTQAIHMLNCSVKIRCGIFTSNLVTQLSVRTEKGVRKSLQGCMRLHT